MNILKLIYRSLIYYKRSHLSVAAGVMILCMVITGALITGDSVKYSLFKISSMRLGKTEAAVLRDNKIFRMHLADEISKDTGIEAVPVLKLNGLARSDSGLQINNAQALGIDSRFWKLGETGKVFNIPAGNALVNDETAAKLNLKKGDSFIVRFYNPDIFPGDSPFALRDNSSAVRLSVHDIITDENMGRFSLIVSQIPALNIFVSIDDLNKITGLRDSANLMLFPMKPGTGKNTIYESLKNNLRYEDLGLKTRDAGFNITEIRTDRVFFEPEISGILLKRDKAEAFLGYFVNTIKYKDRITPYSIISSAPAKLNAIRDDEIIINSWLADDLIASEGGIIELEYYIINKSRQLETKKSVLRINKIIPINDPVWDRTLMPDFPGIAGSDDCRDWNPGIPVDLKRIRAKDEKYWDNYRGTPKAFVALETAQKLWSNPYGSITGVRFPSGEMKQPSGMNIDPEKTGYQYINLHNEAITAGENSVDFSGLFLGLSFFILISALILISLLFIFQIEQRRDEVSVLKAMGFQPKKIEQYIMAENIPVAFLGSAAGILLAVLYNKLILTALGTLWHDAVRTQTLFSYAAWQSILIGFAASFVIPFPVMYFSMKRLIIKTYVDIRSEKSIFNNKGIKNKNILLTCLISISFIVFLLSVLSKGSTVAGFFITGILLLISGIIVFDLFIRTGFKIGIPNKKQEIDFNHKRLAYGNNLRKPGRNIAVAGLISVSMFIIIAVSVNRKDMTIDAGKRESGTGGFTFYCETGIPFNDDLNNNKSGPARSFDKELFKGVEFIPFVSQEGGDASCLNLNRAPRPRLLGINPELMSERNAFSFTKTYRKTGENAWILLNDDLGPDTIPAIIDDTVLVWGLGEKIGDSIVYVNEQGSEIKLKFVAALNNTIFQGSIIISEKNLLKHFPAVNGTQVFLIDNAWEKNKEIREAVARALRDKGLEIQLTSDRLDMFNSVQNTYLSIFLMLGGFGLILGTAGLAILLMRNVLERRKELALMRAVGFNRKMLKRMLVREHFALAAAGITIGLISGLIAVFPVLKSSGIGIPYMTLTIIICGILLSGWLGINIASMIAMRKEILFALREE